MNPYACPVQAGACINPRQATPWAASADAESRRYSRMQRVGGPLWERIGREFYARETPLGPHKTCVIVWYHSDKLN